MNFKCLVLVGLLLFRSIAFFGQSDTNQTVKGKLFIIGGGDRSPQLLQTLISAAQITPRDYIVILPMSGAEPDTSFYYIRQDFEKVCFNTLVQLNFTSELVNKQVWLDSLEKAKLIFITGGDQNRFMEIVLNTPVHKAIKNAYTKGATIAGTSAGAAVMSKQMITGNEYSGDSTISGKFKKIGYHLVEIKEGLGLVNTAIIDQHFIVRSRYNRLLSVLAEYPVTTCIGIDEATAIIVNGKKVTVTGASQVIRLSLPGQGEKNQRKGNQVNLRNVQLDILKSGDVFMLN